MNQLTAIRDLSHHSPLGNCHTARFCLWMWCLCVFTPFFQNREGRDHRTDVRIYKTYHCGLDSTWPPTNLVVRKMQGFPTCPASMSVFDTQQISRSRVSSTRSLQSEPCLRWLTMCSACLRLPRMLSCPTRPPCIILGKEQKTKVPAFTQEREEPFDKGGGVQAAMIIP